MTRDQAAKVLALLNVAGLRYTPEPSADNTRIWIEYLRDVHAQDGADAAREWIATEADYPTVAAFRQLAKRLARTRPAPRNEIPARNCECHDTGFVDVDETANTVRPCPRCNATAHDRWTQRAYNPGNRRAATDTDTLKRIGQLKTAAAPTQPAEHMTQPPPRHDAF